MISAPDGKGKDNEPNASFQIAVAETMGKDYSKYAANITRHINTAR